MFTQDISFMKQALELAQSAFDKGEVPIGSIVVSPEGEVLGQGYNMVEQQSCQLEHAELRAIRQATQRRGDWRLDHCTLYVTLEPCMMCISACALSRIERIVFAARSPIFGYQLDKEGVLALYTRQIKNITEGVLQHEAAALLKRFFNEKGENR
jgi:tRNA(adenine34) deaminase